MALYTTIHLHNVPEDRLDDYAAWFDGPHREALARLRGLTYAERFEITEAQLGEAYQPWRFMSVYDFDYATPEIDLPALGPLLADASDLAGIPQIAEQAPALYEAARAESARRQIKVGDAQTPVS